MQFDMVFFRYHAPRRRRGDAERYPEVFPLSSLFLAFFRMLRKTPKQRQNAKRPQALLVEVPGAEATLLEPPSPLLPFCRTGPSLPAAERARFMRRWLKGAAGPSIPAWEAALMLLIQHQVLRSDVDLWCSALALPVKECLAAAAKEPKDNWLAEVYTLIGREDLMVKPREATGYTIIASRRSARDLLDAEEVRLVTMDPLCSPEWLNGAFNKDRRGQEVARLLSSSRPVTLRVPRRPEQTDLDFEHSKQTRLAQAALRQSALCVGRGAFTLAASTPLPTDLLPIPALVLSGRFPPQAGVQSLDPSHHKQELNVWSEFNNGVAAALQVAKAEVSRGWIAHHRSATATPASSDGQASSNAHAGFLLGLGLRGCLTILPVADCYKYLRLQHEATSSGVILGLAASHVSSMDAGLTRTCCVHIPSMLPATFSDVEVSSSVQCSAVLSLGLLYAGSGHRMMTELLVAEIGRKPSDRVLHDREGYSLAAGFALGCVCLGQGSDAPGLADLQLDTWLLRYILGGPEMPMPGVATREAKRPQESTCQLYEPEGINTCITAPAGCIALALIFLGTNSEAIASRVSIPQNLFQLELLRPDFALLRIVAKSLILWDQMEPTNEWVDRQIPEFLNKLSAKGADIDWLLVSQTKANLAAGACLALGLRFCGTADATAKDVLIARLLGFRDAPRSDAHVALMASRPTPDDIDAITLETCQSTVAFALGMVMAGTGDLEALRALRSLRKKSSLETGYGVHMATHMAIGWLCLGGGRYSFDQKPLSIAALLMAAFPRLPMGLVDNRCHLQAFRHLYALAVRPRN